MQMAYTSTNLLSPFSVLSFTFLTIFVVQRVLVKIIRNRRRLPPSPPKLPVIGHLLQLGLYPHRSLQSLAQRYGHVMLLHLGNAPTLVVSSADAAREIMKTHDLIFANRPDSANAKKLMYNYGDISFVHYGEYWRQLRSICALQLFSVKRVQSFRFIREQETNLLVKTIEKRCSSSSPIDLCELFASLTNDITCRVAFGRKYSEGEDGKKFKNLLKEFAALLGAFNISDFFPWLAWINHFTNVNARVENVFKEFDNFLEEILNDHMACYDEDTKDQKDFIGILLEISNNGSDNISIGRNTLKAVIMIMLVAGIDTIHTALEWTMSQLMKHPKAMNKAQEEIRNMCGFKNIVAEGDLEKMLYLKAVIKESMRLNPPNPLLVPRQSRMDVKVQGYDIVAGTRVIINAWTIGRDPTTWEDAEEFRPDRFLGSSIDLKGHDFQLIPFGAGRRGCPGIEFATSIMEIALAKLLHKFDWELPGGVNPEDLDMKEAPGLFHRKHPLVAMATPHSV